MNRTNQQVPSSNKMASRTSLADISSTSPDLAEKISVAIRVRPFIEREIAAGDKPQWKVGGTELWQCDPDTRKSALGGYAYDHVFGQDKGTKDVYNGVVAPIVSKSLEGFSGTVLCYGQTASGKTYTLYGSDNHPEDRGIIGLFAEQLFEQQKADKGKREYIIRVGLIEIYNEKVYDLLNHEKPIEFIEKEGQVVPKELEELAVFDAKDMKGIAERLQRLRKIGETRMNKESSRSHTILRISIESFNPITGSEDEKPPLTSSVLHFVDLAGSEKQSQTGSEGDRFKEAIHINQSLSKLSYVIQQLSEKQSLSDLACKNPTVNALCSNQKPAPKSKFVNFRGSKLTRLLQSSLNGDSFATMICNVTVASLEETKSTLNFAKLAKKIQVQPKRNVLDKSNKLAYEQKLGELQGLLMRKDEEMMAMNRQLENYKRALNISFVMKPAFPQEGINRRMSFCPSVLRFSENKSTMSEFAYPRPLSSRASVPTEETFMTAEETMHHFRQLAVVAEACEDKSSVDTVDREVQTAPTLLPLTLKTPKKQAGTGRKDTPIQTLRLTNSLLRETCEKDRTEWEDQKGFLELELQALRQETSESRDVYKAKEELEVKLATKDEQVTKLDATIVSLESELRRLREEHTAKLSETEIGTEKVMQKITELGEELVTKVEYIQKLEATIVSFESHTRSLQEEHMTKLSEAASETEKVTQKISELEEELIRKNDHIKELEATVVSLESHVTSVKEEHMAKLSETEIGTERLLQKSRELEKKLATKDEDVAKLQTAVASLQSDIILLREEHITKLSEAKNGTENVLQKNTKLEEEFVTKEELIKELEATVVSFESQVKSLKEEHMAKISENEIETEKVMQQNTELVEELVTKEELIKKLESVVASFESHVTSVKDEQTAKLSDTESETEKVMQKNTELEKELATKDEKVKTLEATVISFESRFQSLKEEHMAKISETESASEKVIQKNKELEKELATKDEKVTKLEASVASLESDIRRWREEHITELSEAKNDTENVMQKNTKLEEELVTKVEDVKKLESTIILLESHFRRLREEHNAKLSEAKNSTEKVIQKISKLEEELIRKNDHIKELEATVVSLESHVTSVKEEHMAKLSETEIGTEKVMQRNTELEKKLATKDEHVTKLEAAVASLESDIRLLREEHITRLSEAKNGTENVMQRNTKLEEELVTKEELIKELEAGVVSLESQVKSLKEEHMAKLSETEIGTEKVMQQNTELEKELATKDEKVSKLEAALSSLESDVRCLKDEHNTKLSEAKEGTENVMQKNTELEEELVTKEEVIKKLESSVVLFESQIKSLKEEHMAKLSETEIGTEKLLQENTELEKKLATKDEHVTKLEASVVSLESDIRRLREENVTKLSEAKDGKEKVMQKNRELEKKLTTKDEHVAQLEAAAVSFESHVRNMKEEHMAKISETESGTEKVIQKNKELEKELATKDEKVTKLDETIILLESDIRRLREEHVAKLSKVKNESVNLVHKNTELEKELATKDGHVKKLEAKIISIESDFKSLKEEHIANLTETKAMTEKLQRHAISQRAGTTNRPVQCELWSENFFEEYRGAVKHYSQKCRLLQVDIDKLKANEDKQLKEKNKQLADWNEEANKKSDEIRKLTTKISQLQNMNFTHHGTQCTLLKEQVDRTVQGEKDVLPDFIPDTTKLRNEVKYLRDRLATLQIKINKCTCIPSIVAFKTTSYGQSQRNLTSTSSDSSTTENLRGPASAPKKFKYNPPPNLSTRVAQCGVPPPLTVKFAATSNPPPPAVTRPPPAEDSDDEDMLTWVMKLTGKKN